MFFRPEFLIAVVFYIVTTFIMGFLCGDYYPIVEVESFKSMPIYLFFFEFYKNFFIYLNFPDILEFGHWSGVFLFPIVLFIAFSMINLAYLRVCQHIHIILISYFIIGPLVLFAMNYYLISYDFVFFHINSIVLLPCVILGYTIRECWLSPDVDEVDFGVIDFVISLLGIIILYIFITDEFQSTLLASMFCMIVFGFFTSLFYTSARFVFNK